MTKKFLKRKYLLYLVIFFYIISNILIFNLLSRSQHQKNLNFCKRDLQIVKLYHLRPIVELINDLKLEISVMPEITVQSNFFQITMENENLCNEKIKEINDLIKIRVDNLVKTNELIVNFSKNNSTIDIQLASMLALIEIYENGNNLIELKVIDAVDGLITNKAYDFVIYIIFNLILTFLFISLFFFYKKLKPFGLKIK